MTAAMLLCIAIAAGEGLRATSDGTSTWFALARDDGRVEVLLNEIGMEGLSARRLGVLPELPESMAASGSRAWVLMPADAEGRRRVHELRAPISPLPSLRGDVGLFGADGEGPFAVVDGSVWRLGGDSWKASAESPPAVGQIPGLWPPAQARMEAGRVELVRGGVRLAEFPLPGSPWALTGRGGAPWLWRAETGASSITGGPPIDFGVIGWRVDGRGDPPAPLTPWGIGILRWFHVPVVAVAAILAWALAMSMRRSMAIGAVPSGFRPLGASARLAAFAIDYAPAAILALLLTGASPAALLDVPGWTPDLARCGTASLAILLACTWATAMEAFLGASAGKLALGARLLRAGQSGAAPGAPRAILRGTLKVVVLLAPVLVVPMLLWPDGRGIPEAASGTVLARPVRPSARASRPGEGPSRS